MYLGTMAYKPLQFRESAEKVDSNSHLAPFSITGFPACSTKSGFFVEWAREPVPKKLVENGARSQFQCVCSRWL
jgi:hypothetical protein